MKFHVRTSNNIGFFIEFGIEPSFCDVKKAIVSKFKELYGIEELEELSLNGLKHLEAEGSEKVSAVGLVTGDIIWVMNAIKLHRDINKGQLKMATLSQPTRIVDCRNEELPACVVESLKHCCRDEKECIILLLHHMMLEMGFTSKFKNIPEDSKEYFKLSYVYQEANCVILCTVMQSKVIINGYGASFPDNYSLVIDADDYIADWTNDVIGRRVKALPELTILFKDHIAGPLLVRCQLQLGVIPVLLSTLPGEVLILITKHLDTRSILNLGETCRRLREVIQVPQVWRNLVHRYFPKTRYHISMNSMNTVNWLMMFKSYYLNSAQNRAPRHRCSVPCRHRQPHLWTYSPITRHTHHPLARQHHPSCQTRCYHSDVYFSRCPHSPPHTHKVSLLKKIITVPSGYHSIY